MENSKILKAIVMVLLLVKAGECLKTLYGRRKYWIRPVLRNRNTHGFFANNFCFPEEFKRTIRMEKHIFDLLLNFIKERLTKHSNRPSISPECRLYLTLA